MLNYKKKKAQDQKSKIFSLKPSKKAQEEIAGFALILVLLGIILLGFLAASLNKKTDNNVHDYEVEAYIQAILQQTARCEVQTGYLDVKDLIFECHKETECLDGNSACAVLDQTIRAMLDDSWGARMGENDLYKGYEFVIVFNRGQETDVEVERLMDPISEGETHGGNCRVGNCKEGSQTFPKSGQDISTILKVWF